MARVAYTRSVDVAGTGLEARRRRGAYEVLAVASRAIVLEQVRARQGGVDASTLAGTTGLHPNTVRFHLDVLARAGLVRSTPDPAGNPGRPRLLFTATCPEPPTGAPAPTTSDGYALLAAVLIRHLPQASADPGQLAQDAGRAWAVARPESDSESDSESDAGGAMGRDSRVAAVTALFDEIGFAPEAVRDGEDWRILLHRCPFHALAAESPDIVCRMHLGLLQGALDRLGGSGSAVRLEPFVLPRLCEAFVPSSALAGPG